ncbi:SGNH/GDSL hydrolase family protein [Mucilaginibacter phyllosphaerae]|uniref:Lysophospholipase L1-like esterase n=1 Tax=Mucilaginibacter phyllosphaerae TaxID=1812349 RepID=A0A4Y8AGU2_9SPHI|nr:SGNH/GDSL hydrolase family protein [Mucilaginibacter phyllosphaerae]MBB3968398.1 lysophospholipase L1-like esterase [Mucilaginibacter phyllosphaerae]TEW67954.1 twin-arginine translocation signal domain-containing protein [Mucilaginibacter phyllosphaerae]GGH16239.1 lipase [Mucilaginibacter phyllosphaerae]
MKDHTSNSRRNFIKNTAMGAVAALSIPQIVSAAVTAPAGKKIQLNKDDVILFQGDSITDWGRDHNKTTPNDTGALGNGYTLLAAGELLARFPEKNLQIYNKGVSGNKVYQLAERWDTDCIALKPTVVSIHIGVNDFWHTLTSGYTGTIETYINDYKKLLDRTKAALPGVKFIIGEPFGLTGTKFVDAKWYPTFDLFRKAARDIATQYDAPFIPYQTIFNNALKSAPATYWTLDGVHPSIAGEKLMAQGWMETLKG